MIGRVAALTRHANCLVLRIQTHQRNGHAMRTLLPSASALLLLPMGQPACAADLPTKAPIFAAQATYNWTGFYLGAHVGAGWASDVWDASSFINLGEPLHLGAGSASGFLGGVQAGVNYQIDAMVFGLEADASWAQISGEACNTIQGAVHCTSAANRFGTVTGRFGIAADRALVYLKGGAAWLHDEHTLSILGALDTTVSGNRWGWTAGAGIEYALTRNWSAKLEYDFMDFGTQQHLFVTTLVGTLNSTIAVKEQIQTAKFGLNYKFDWASAGGY
jgi:outer membrane immunogenic protein